ncbi:MAG: CopG family transcriptional regulator [Elusimicrobia bacterium]|jgi:predicted DNA binding CopG/RHH family protein|nr:CopG family transcriptional regulator [Elusimicrobiota bacterium]
MKQKTKYTNETIQARVVRDFLPPPEDLVFKEDNVKVTMFLSRSSVEFFKHTARQRHTHYQKMIRNLLDTYADKFK